MNRNLLTAATPIALALGMISCFSADVSAQYPTQGQIYPAQQQGYPTYTTPYQTPNYGTQIPQGTYQYPQGTYQQPTYPQGVIPAQPPQVTHAKSHWSFSLKPEKNHHDFGAVAKASNQEHIFEFENKLDTDIHLTAVYASCGCTRPKILTPVVKPGEIGKLHAKFDTITFDGSKQATVTLRVEKRGQFTELGEMQFMVKGNIRRDVVLNPGAVSFGDAKVNESISKTVKLSYAGDPRWQVMKVTSSSPFLTASAVETRRDPQTGRVDYDLVVKMTGEQPEGMVKESLMLTTNDVQNKEMAVEVTGSVKPSLVVAPINLGLIKEGKTITKKLIIRGAQPFEIKNIKVNDSRIKFKQAEGQKTLHILIYELEAKGLGDIEDEITIVTSDANQSTAKVPFSAKIVPEVMASGN